MPRPLRSSATLRSILVVLVALLFCTLSLLLLMPQAQAESARPAVALAGAGGSTHPEVGAAQGGTGAITGTVLMHSGSVPGSARVNVCPVSAGESCLNINNGDTNRKEGWPDSNGHYEVAGLAPGPYNVLFEGDYRKVRQDVYFNNVTNYISATQVTVTDGQTTGNINGTLVGFSSIAGKVTNAQGVGIPGVEVILCTPESMVNCVPPVWHNGGAVTYTVANGTYLLDWVDAGTFKVRFSHDDYLTEYSGNSYDLSRAQTVTVGIEGSLTGVNASLARAASATGRVVDEEGNPVVGIRVTFEPEDGAFPTIRTTDATGAYTVTTIAAGRYKIKFVYLPDVESYRTHEIDYTLEVGDNTIPNQTLIKSRELSGKLTVSGGGAPLPSAGVAACLSTTDCTRFQGFDTYFGSTDASGNYHLTGMAPGKYYLILNTNNGAYLGELYPEITGYQQGAFVSLTGATLIDLTTALSATIDAHLDIPATISGKVTAQGSGAPIAGITVTGCRVTIDDGCPLLASAVTDASGEYSFARVSPGFYRLAFTDSRPVPLYAQFRPTAFEVVAGEDVTRNAVLSLVPTPTPTHTPTHTPTATPLGTPPTTPSATPTPTATPSPTPRPTVIATLAVLPNGAGEVTIDENDGLKAGQSIQLQVPAGAVDEPTLFSFGTLTLSAPQAGVGVFVFSISATQGGSPADGLHFNVPVTLTLTYRDDDFPGLKESNLSLRFHDPVSNTWRDEGIEVVLHEPAVNRLTLRLHHLTTFALYDASVRVLLPVVGGNP